MTRRPWLPTAAVAAGLALLLAAEWLLPGPAAPILPMPAPISATAPDPAADAEIGQWAQIVLARPLFNADRRPVSVASAAVDDTLPRLSAIIVSSGIRRAIFAQPGQKPQSVAEGGAIGAYRLIAIGPDRVELLGPQGPVTLHPQFMTTAPAAVAN